MISSIEHLEGGLASKITCEWVPYENEEERKKAMEYLESWKQFMEKKYGSCMAHDILDFKDTLSIKIGFPKKSSLP